MLEKKNILQDLACKMVVLYWGQFCPITTSLQYLDLIIYMDTHRMVFVTLWKKQEQMPNGIMDGLFSKVNQKVNLGQRPAPPARTSLFYRTDI